MAGELRVELVAAERKVWSGEATIVITRTTEGDIGIMPGHAPVLGLLVTGLVTIRSTNGDEVTAAVHGGFLSVADDVVSILAEVAELSDEIDVDSLLSHRLTLDDVNRGFELMEAQDGIRSVVVFGS